MLEKREEYPGYNWMTRITWQLPQEVPRVGPWSLRLLSPLLFSGPRTPREGTQL